MHLIEPYNYARPFVHVPANAVDNIYTRIQDLYKNIAKPHPNQKAVKLLCVEFYFNILTFFFQPEFGSGYYVMYTQKRI